MKSANPYVKADEIVRKIMRAAFPDWKGREVEIKPHDGTINLASYWSGGSRSFFAFVRLSDLKSMGVPAQSMFDRPITGIDRYRMMPGALVVEWSVYRGKRMTPIIYVHPENVSQVALPAPAVELDLIHALGLLVTRRYISAARYKEFNQWTNASKAQYEAVRVDLQAMGLLKKNNSLTTEGKNVVSQWDDEYAVVRAYGIDPVEYLRKTRGW